MAQDSQSKTSNSTRTASAGSKTFNKGKPENPEKDRALSAALAQIERQFGKVP
jgi:hypothetical protein